MMIPAPLVIVSLLLLVSNVLMSAAQDVDLYLIIGQSNAAGRDLNIDLAGRDQPDPNVLVLNDRGEMEVAFQPLNAYSTIQRDVDQGVNFGLEFGKVMTDYTGKPTALVVNARGSTTISEWRRGGEFFQQAVERVIAAEMATGSRLMGILWHQGESDVHTQDTGDYFDNLIDMITEFREELGDVPFLCGQLHYKGITEVFNGVLRLVDDRYFPLSNVEWVSASELTTLDGVHFDADSTREFGLRYANTMKEFLSAI